jgi:pimeloyl-ACP methyl ester carboxylesterase
MNKPAVKISGMRTIPKGSILETELDRPNGNIPVTVPYIFRERVGRPAIAFLHGLGCSQKDFAPAFGHQALANYSLLTFNYPGCGGTEYPANAQLGVEDLATITHDLITYLGLRRVILVGHSMGGLVGQSYLQKGRLPYATSFANVEGNLVPEDCFYSRQVADMGLDAFLGHGFMELKQKLTGSQDKANVKYALNLDEADPSAFFYYSRSLVRHSDNDNLLGEFVGMDRPKIYMYGAKSGRAEHSLPALAGLKAGNVPTVGIPGSGHFPMHDDPAAFYRAIADFEEQYPI